MRDELLNGELFYSLREAQILIEQWRAHYNTVRPHSSLGGKTPAEIAAKAYPGHAPDMLAIPPTASHQSTIGLYQ